MNYTIDQLHDLLRLKQERIEELEKRCDALQRLADNRARQRDELLHTMNDNAAPDRGEKA